MQNFPDAMQRKLMDEQRRVMMGYVAETNEALVVAKARLVRCKRLLDRSNPDQMREVAEAEAEIRECERIVAALKDMMVADVLWCDPERTNDTAFGGFGCWGSNITDVRLQHRKYQKDAGGNKITGTETEWLFCQILMMGNNTQDTRTVLDAENFYLITADDDGSNKARKSLKEITTNLKRFFPSEGLETPRMRVDRVAVAHRMAFVPVPADSDRWAVEVRYVCLGYNTMTESAPKNLLFFGDTMNLSVFAEKPGRAAGFQPLYTNLRTSVTGQGEEDGEAKMRSFATAVEPTNRTIKNIGIETAEESAAAAAAGKGTQVRTGPASLKGTSSCAWCEPCTRTLRNRTFLHAQPNTPSQSLRGRRQQQRRR